MTDPSSGHDVVLASGSRIRRALLQSAGLSFTVAPADLDEGQIRHRLQSENDAVSAEDIALALATAKAKLIAKDHANALVIGCDQTLKFEDRIYEKARDLTTIRETLLSFRGKTHRLCSAVAIVQNSDVIWSTVQHADLTMRNYSENFIDEYLARVGNEAMDSLGGYQLEAQGIQLFDSIDGDYFTVLGLPLLSLVKELRSLKVLMV